MDMNIPPLLDLLYESLSRPECFPSFMESLCEHTDSQTCYIEAFQALPDGTVGAVPCPVKYTSPSIDDHIEQYVQEGVGLNPYFLLLAPTMATGCVRYAKEVIPFKEFEDTDHYRLWLKPIESREIAGICLRQSDDTTVMAAFHQGGGNFRPKARQFFSFIAPHLARFYTLTRELGEVQLLRDATWELLDFYRHGILLLNGQGRTLFINRAAKALVDGHHGLGFRNGRPYLQACRAQQQFQSLLDSYVAIGGRVLELPVSSILVPRKSPHKPLQMLVSPLGKAPLSTHHSTPISAVFIFDPEQPLNLSVDQLVNLYGLTPTEARLGLLIAQGFSLEEAATQLGHKLSTSRNLLKRVFAKTDTGRQHELAAQLLRNSLPLSIPIG